MEPGKIPWGGTADGQLCCVAGHVWAFQLARGPDGTLSCDGVQLAGSSRGSFPAGRSESVSLVLNLPEQMG